MQQLHLTVAEPQTFNRLRASCLHQVACRLSVHASIHLEHCLPDPMAAQTPTTPICLVLLTSSGHAKPVSGLHYAHHGPSSALTAELVAQARATHPGVTLVFRLMRCLAQTAAHGLHMCRTLHHVR